MFKKRFTPAEVSTAITSDRAPMMAGGIARHMGCCARTATNLLHEMLEAGTVSRTNSGSEKKPIWYWYLSDGENK